jgi:hypothetical protein
VRRAIPLSYFDLESGVAFRPHRPQGSGFVGLIGDPYHGEAIAEWLPAFINKIDCDAMPKAGRITRLS